MQFAGISRSVGLKQGTFTLPHSEVTFMNNTMYDMSLEAKPLGDGTRKFR